jgi:N-acetylneuraminate lyase
MNKLKGLVAATHTPFDATGALRLSTVEKQAEHLLRQGVMTVFIAGTTGECSSLTVEERLALTRRWTEVAKGSSLKVIVHVGSNCLADACTLAQQAQELGVYAIAALSPSYFKPRTLEALVDCCQQIASRAPEVPFYFYDIPVLTGVSFSMPEFLELASQRIPSLVGIKFTNPDLMAYQQCLHKHDGRFDVPWGVDEYLLAALALGATGAVGSSYNFAAPLYLQIIAAFEKGELATARHWQFRSVQLISILSRYGYMAAAKAYMEMQGVPVGQPRLPHPSLTAEQRHHLQAELHPFGLL